MNRLVITGAQSGIGAATARKWAGTAIKTQCDVTDSRAFQKELRSQDFDILVNNAGVGHAGFNNWEQTLAVNLGAVIAGTQTAISLFRERRKPGCIVNVASLAGLVPAPFSPAYCATKAGVVFFVRSLALDRKLKEDGISVHALCPSFADTPLVSRIMEPQQDEDSRRAAKFIGKAIDAQGGNMHVDVVADALLRIIDDAQSGVASPIATITPDGFVYTP